MNTARGVRTVAVLLMLAGCSSGGGGSAGKGGSGAGAGGSGGQAGAASGAAGSGPGGAAGTHRRRRRWKHRRRGRGRQRRDRRRRRYWWDDRRRGRRWDDRRRSRKFEHRGGVPSYVRDQVRWDIGLLGLQQQRAAGQWRPQQLPDAQHGRRPCGRHGSCDRRQRYLRDSQRRQSLLLGQHQQYSARGSWRGLPVSKRLPQAARTSVSSTTPTPCGARAITPQGSWAMATARHPVPHRCL